MRAGAVSLFTSMFSSNNFEAIGKPSKEACRVRKWTEKKAFWGQLFKVNEHSHGKPRHSSCWSSGNESRALADKIEFGLWAKTKKGDIYFLFFSSTSCCQRCGRQLEVDFAGSTRKGPSGISLLEAGLLPSRSVTSVWGFIHTFMPGSAPFSLPPTWKSRSTFVFWKEPQQSQEGSGPDLPADPRRTPYPRHPRPQRGLDFCPLGSCAGQAGRDPETVPTKLPSWLQTFVLSTELQKMQFVLLMSSLFG